MNFIQSLPTRVQPYVDQASAKLTVLKIYLTDKNATEDTQKRAVAAYEIAMPVIAALGITMAVSLTAFLLKPVVGVAVGAYLFLNKDKIAQCDKTAKAALIVAALAIAYFQPLFAVSATLSAVLYPVAARYCGNMPKNWDALMKEVGDKPRNFITNKLNDYFPSTTTDTTDTI